MAIDVDYAIVGTGPSGIAAAAALIKLGVKPVFIDAGDLTNGMVITASNRQNLKTKSAAITPTNPGQKAWFGSYEAYSQHFPSRLEFAQGLHVRSSNSIGGFSRVWGATFEFWPSDPRWARESFPIEEDFAAIRNLVAHSTTEFTTNTKPFTMLTGAQTSSGIYRQMISRGAKLEPSISPSTLAIKTAGPRACTVCSKCLDGCPQDAIWFSGDQLESWLREGKATLQSGLKVDSISETHNQVTLNCISEAGSVLKIRANRVFLASGALGTAEIVIRSGLVNEVEISDTSTIFTAAIGLRSEKLGLPGHSLSQFWLKWTDGSPIAAQIYAPNESNLQRLLSRFPMFRALGQLLSPLVMRMHPVVAYLDSSVSPRLNVKSVGGVIRVTEVLNDKYSDMRKLAVRKIRRSLRLGGLFVPPVGTDFSPAGTGYHHGSSFPMGTKADNLGRISGWRLVHVVDSSVLPYLNVGSITPTVMANAHRIVRESVK